MKTCASCGSTANNNAKRCPTCGANNFKADAAGSGGAAQTGENESLTFDFSDRRNEILLKIARPDIYRINAFRTLGIPVTATPKEISSHIRKLDLMEKLGNQEQTETGFLSLIPPPDTDARHEARQRLGNPEPRFFDEFFWFWPLEAENKSDEALEALKKNDFAGAVSIWKQRERSFSEANVSMHNLAIMFHVLALDMEYMQADNLTPKQTRQKLDYWVQAFSRWQVLLKYEGFWNRLSKRVQEINDPRLPSATVDKLRAGLPIVLLSVNASLAVKAIERGNREEVKRQINLIQNSNFSRAIINEALRRAVAPTRDRLKTICTNAENEAKKDAADIPAVIQNLLEQSAQPLETLDALLPAENPVRESIHDEIADLLNGMVVSSASKTKDWKAALNTLKQALQIAMGASIRKRIEENITAAKEMSEYGMCWFCKKIPAQENANLEIKMHGDVNNDGTRITWHYVTVTVPRCTQCKSAHSHLSWLSVLGWFLGIGLAILIGISTSNGWLGAGIGVICIILGYIIPAVTKPDGVKPESFMSEFPPIKERLAKGWDYGEKPPDAQEN